MVIGKRSAIKKNVKKIPKKFAKTIDKRPLNGYNINCSDDNHKRCG